MKFFVSLLKLKSIFKTWNFFLSKILASIVLASAVAKPEAESEAQWYNPLMYNQMYRPYQHFGYQMYSPYHQGYNMYNMYGNFYNRYMYKREAEADAEAQYPFGVTPYQYGPYNFQYNMPYNYQMPYYNRAYAFDYNRYNFYNMPYNQGYNMYNQGYNMFRPAYNRLFKREAEADAEAQIFYTPYQQSYGYNMYNYGYNMYNSRYNMPYNYGYNMAYPYQRFF